MQNTPSRKMTRRAFAATALTTSLAATPAFSMVVESIYEVTGGSEPKAPPSMVKRNVSSFKTRTWEPYFQNLRNGAILADTQSRVLHFWSEDGQTYRLFPTSVPASPELTRLGRTRVVQKKEGPDWRPTQAMLERNPEWPAYVPPGPDNPMGTHALYLSWRFYRIHGTHDPEKIGRRSSSGCIGLYNEHIAELFELTTIGTRVLLI